jgi:hypothetical protein
MPTDTKSLHPTYRQLVRDAIAEEVRRFPEDVPTVMDVMGTASFIYRGDVEHLDPVLERLEAYAAELLAAMPKPMTTRSVCSERWCQKVQPIERDAVFGWWVCTVCGCDIICTECGDRMDDQHEGEHDLEGGA